ncbi:MAG TPA: energy transducer TonB [Leptospiraceae bacterium]|nr:energy transducer TonB [Leptospiraceae bacterium]HNN02216.1 energy transducer TonB [Leptospiraceae bacterium]
MKGNEFLNSILQLECCIDEAGTLNRAEIISGPEPYGFNEAASEVIQRINFYPGKTGGKPIKSKHRVPVAFSLD